MNHITIHDFQELKLAHGQLQIVDVRSPDEYRTGHIPGAMNLPMEQALARKADLQTGARVILVCQSGVRAEITRATLEHSGLETTVLSGGTAAWIDAGLPTVSDGTATWSLERQVRLIAGILVLIGGLGGLIFKPITGLAIFVGAGLTFAGLTNICGMGLLLAKMPWNRPKAEKMVCLKELKNER